MQIHLWWSQRFWVVKFYLSYYRSNYQGKRKSYFFSRFWKVIMITRFEINKLELLLARGWKCSVDVVAWCVDEVGGDGSAGTRREDPVLEQWWQKMLRGDVTEARENMMSMWSWTTWDGVDTTKLIIEMIVEFTYWRTKSMYLSQDRTSTFCAVRGCRR